MVYDAIINGARGLFFFGGNNAWAWETISTRATVDVDVWNGV